MNQRGGLFKTGSLQRARAGANAKTSTCTSATTSNAAVEDEMVLKSGVFRTGKWLV